MPSKYPSNYDTIFYHVRPGDNLSTIIKRYYGSVSSQQRKDIISRILAGNPAIKNPNLIYQGQALVIDIPEQYCAAPSSSRKTPIIRANRAIIKPLQRYWQSAPPRERNSLSALVPIMLGTGAASMMMINKTFKTNAPLLAEIVESYNDYKGNKITKGQYDYSRKQLISKLKTKLGPTKLLLHGFRSPNEVLRISRTKGSAPTGIMISQIDKMTKLSKYASRGGVVLSAVGLGVACYQIANTDDKQEKNEILMESLGGFMGGLAYSGAAALAIFIIATPVGWVAALVIGVGGALTGAAAGYGLKNFYTTHLNHIDFTKKTGIDYLCR